ncbi:hypothetical protein [Rhodoferax sp.]|uniref:hypothetical protein n=1 Tax=Rhodoferax sp. TaxID=50421 RepID=UPI00262F005D|nr:hypothetical protein [Rhodoferax sp.]MDD2918967.1 hypothetical protein [Rhodoferax sp.]
MSEKRQKFVELAEKRVTRAIKDLRLIGNLSNRNNYTYSDSDVQKIVSALDMEVKNLKSKFATDDGKAVQVFKLQ